MNLRRCAALRTNAVTHYFIEGEFVTLCGRYMTDDYTTRKESEPVTCHRCVQRLPRGASAPQEEEEAS